LQCEAATFGNICDNPAATVFLDQYDNDNIAALEVGQALQNACSLTLITPPSSEAGVLADAGVFDPTSGRPTTGFGNICVIGGGAYGQKTVGYLDNSAFTSVYLRGANDDAGVYTLYFTDRSAPGGPRDVASAPFGATGTDYFLVQLAIDPVSGSLCLQVMGMSGTGTVAAGYYVANHFIANGAYASSTKSWYVYQWTDVDEAGAPDEQDTYTLIASGP
jgi:hypothetical protein